ncbi:MAG TPA: hypothetical protein PLY93_04530 [Turneriella sp.]|nr:hypothetical protein [Turneriella sp.]
MERFKNKYRIATTRLQNWDYRWAGAYFITVCTQNRLHYFGEIKNGQMQLSPIGVIADVLWHEIKNHTKNVELGEFIVMPNHIYGVLIIIDNNDTINADAHVETGHTLSLRGDIALSLRGRVRGLQTIGQQRFQNIGKNSISSIVGSYKSAVTKHAHRLGFDFVWQRLFHDRIIRNENSLHRITNYIRLNPENWQKDTYFKIEEPP